MPQEAHDEPRRDPEIAPPLVERVGQSGEHRVERHASVGMRLRIEEYLDMRDVLGRDFLQISESQIKKILPRSQHGHPGVIEVKKFLQRIEAVSIPDRLDAGIRQRHAISPRERHHHLGFQRALDVKMQFRLRHGRNKAAETRLVDERGPSVVPYGELIGRIRPSLTRTRPSDCRSSVAAIRAVIDRSDSPGRTATRERSL